MNNVVSLWLFTLGVCCAGCACARDTIRYLVPNSNFRTGSLRCRHETTTDQLSVMSRASLYPCELVYQHNSVKLNPWNQIETAVVNRGNNLSGRSHN